MLEVQGQGHTLVQVCSDKGIHIDAGMLKSIFCATLYFRQEHDLSEQPAEHMMSRHSSDGDGVRAGLTNTNPATESVLDRNGSSSAENELCGSVDSGSVGSTNVFGRKSNVHRNER